MTELLDTLLSVPTVSGGEKAIIEIIDRYIKKSTDTTHTDALGNLTATRSALPKKGKKPTAIAFFCAVDAPGRIVTYLEENGLVRTAPIGKMPAEHARHTEVTKIGSKYTGILFTENDKNSSAEPLYADFGFACEKEAAKHISLGDLLGFSAQPVWLNKHILYAPALGNKLCAVTLAALAAQIVPSAAVETSFIFGTQSALGARGAAPAAFAAAPAIAVCLEPYEGKEIGLRLSDRYSVSDEELVRQMKNAAAQVGVSLVPTLSDEERFTDAARINGAGSGVRTVTLLYPIKGLGLVRERADIRLREPLVRLLLQFLSNF